MTDTVLVRPLHGLILAGIPAKGAAIPRALADEWIADQLIERIPTTVERKPVVRRARTTKRATSPRKRRTK
jgi:hypothetical protein